MRFPALREIHLRDNAGAIDGNALVELHRNVVCDVGDGCHGTAHRRKAANRRPRLRQVSFEEIDLVTPRIVVEIRPGVVGDPGDIHPGSAVDSLVHHARIRGPEVGYGNALCQCWQVATHGIHRVVAEECRLRRIVDREVDDELQQLTGGGIALMKGGHGLRFADAGIHPHQTADTHRSRQFIARSPKPWPHLMNQVVPAKEPLVDVRRDHQRCHRLRRRGDGEVGLLGDRGIGRQVANPKHGAVDDASPVHHSDRRTNDVHRRRGRLHGGVERLPVLSGGGGRSRFGRGGMRGGLPDRAQAGGDSGATSNHGRPA